MNISKRNTTLITITSWLLCSLFVLQIANQAFYSHSHITEDGKVISHAHPFQKDSDSSPIKEHSHTQSDFLLLAQLNILFLTASAVITLFIVLGYQVIFKGAKQFCLSGYSVRKSGRSPPLTA